MNQAMKHAVSVCLGISLGLCASLLVQAQTQTKAQPQPRRVYAVDSRGEIVKNSDGQCLRNSLWTLRAAAQDSDGCACDNELLPRGVCGTRAEAPVAPPAPVVAKAPHPPTPAPPAPSVPVPVVPLKVAPALPVIPLDPPAPKAAPKPLLKTILGADAMFDFDQSTLRAAGKTKLNEIAAATKPLAIEVVIIVGHSDRLGSAAYNQKLSEQRAISVKNYLVSKGVPSNRIYTEGQGSKRPVTRASDCAGVKDADLIKCLQPDRRIDIEIIGERK